MLTINSSKILIADLSLIESQFEFAASNLPQSLNPEVSFYNRMIEVPELDRMFGVGIESTVLARVGSQEECGPLFSCKVVVGCTVVVRAAEMQPSLEQEMIRCAVETNVGFARTLIFQQALQSQFPVKLIIPPLSFNGKLD